MLRDYNPLGPAYIIIAGAQSGEGAVIAKAFNATAEKAHEPMTNVDVWPLTEALSDAPFTSSRPTTIASRPRPASTTAAPRRIASMRSARRSSRRPSCGR